MLNIDKIIEVKENKSLKLHNTLVKKLTLREIREFSKSVEVFQGQIKARKLNIVGPLIVKNESKYESGTIVNNVYLILQVDSIPDKVDYLMDFKSELVVKNCLYSRFKGIENYANLSTYKLQVYAYENNILLKGSYYTIFVDKKDTGVVIDTFMETDYE